MAEAATGVVSSARQAGERLRWLLAGARQTTWEVAEILHRVYTAAEWRDGYVSFADWLMQEHIPLSRGTISKLIAAVTAIRGFRPTERQRWLAHTEPVRVYKVRQLISKHRSTAYELASTELSDAELQRVIQENLPDQHLEPGVRRVMHWVKPATFALWQQVLSLIRVHLGTQGTAHPSDDDVISAIAQTVLLAPELSNMPEERLSAVLTGEVRCVLCESYAHLEQHHVVPRSHGGRDAQGVERLCWLCAPCHAGVTDGRTSWRALAARLGVEIRGE